MSLILVNHNKKTVDHHPHGGEKLTRSNEHLAGFMTALELELYQSVPSSEFNTYWIPCTWFVNLLKEARKTHRLPDAQGLKLIMEVRIYKLYVCLLYLFA